MIASPRNRFIICLDTVLLVIFILLLSPRMTGLALHEILGFIFFIPILIHLLIAWPWIQNATGKFFKAYSRRTRINFFLNAILFILVVSELISGFVISEIVMPWLGINTINDRSWRAVHNLPLNFVMLFTGLHIAINWGWIVSALKKLADIQRPGKQKFSLKPVTLFLRILIIVLAACPVFIVLYSIIGKPSPDRIYSQNEIGRFTPSLSHGLLQMLGEIFLIALVAFIARKWLRIRL